jgi:hypothetical protein
VPLSRLMKTYDFLYFLYWCAAVSIEQQRGFDTGVVIPFSRYLDRAGVSRDIQNPVDVRPDRRRNEGGKIRLCYLAEFAYDGKGNALAPVMQNLLESLSKYYPGEYELYLYAWKYKDPEVLERVRSLGVCVRSFDLSEYSETELVRLRRSFAGDHIDVVITDMNSAVPHYLFENRVAPAQIFYQLGMPFWRLRKLDGVFQGWQIAPETLGFRPEQCHFMPAPESMADLNPSVDPARVQAERHRFPRAERIAGFYGRLVKITPEFCNIALRILERHPGTIVALGGTGNAEPILQFVKEHGLEDRMFVINEFVDGHVWGHVLDIFLDTFPLMGGYSCREVMAKGKPVVYMPSTEMPNLQMLRDPGLQAVTSEEYIAHVSRLLGDPDSYRRACSRALELSTPADARMFAGTLHSALRKVRTPND